MALATLLDGQCKPGRPLLVQQSGVRTARIACILEDTGAKPTPARLAACAADTRSRGVSQYGWVEEADVEPEHFGQGLELPTEAAGHRAPRCEAGTEQESGFGKHDWAWHRAPLDLVHPCEYRTSQVAALIWVNSFGSIRPFGSRASNGRNPR